MSKLLKYCEPTYVDMNKFMILATVAIFAAGILQKPSAAYQVLVTTPLIKIAQ